MLIRDDLPVHFVLFRDDLPFHAVPG